MKRIWLIIIGIGVIAPFLFMGFSPLPAGNDDFRTLENKAFKQGEKLVFSVKYGFVDAGEATMSIPATKTIAGRQVYQLSFAVNSLPSFEWFYKVRTRYESYMDVKGLFPWRFEQHIREGNFSNDFSAFFDQKRGIAKTSEGQYEMPRYTQDIISAFYFARTIDYSKMKKGDKVRLQNFYGKKVHNLDVLFHGRETVTSAAGKFDCVIVEPYVKEGGLFKNEGSILIWLTDDEAKMPVLVKTKIVIGSIDAELKSYENVAGKLTSKK